MSEYFEAHRVIKAMISPRGRLLLQRLGIVTLIVLSIGVSTLRPLTRRSDSPDRPRGLVRMSLLSEAPAHDASSVPAPVALPSFLFVLQLVTLELIVLKVHHREFQSIPVRRLRIPPRSAPTSSPAH